jgi:hypothetical protein
VKWKQPAIKNVSYFESIIKQYSLLRSAAILFMNMKIIILMLNSTFIGYMKDGMRHGHGVQVWPDGARYEGEWSKNQANGKGKFWHADGDIYEGDWRDDKANGYGVYIHVNGARYEGYWKNDL